MHGRHGELTLVEFLSEPVDLASSGTEDDGLGNGDSLVQVTESVEFPVFLVDRYDWAMLALSIDKS